MGEGDQVKTKVVSVTPQKAKEWLEGNTNNRAINKRRVALYASDMQRGAWIVTHQGIAIDEDGNLIDGQHRLHAVLEANIAVPMMVTTGIPRIVHVNGHHNIDVHVMDVLDGGQPRGMGQRLQLGHGVPNANLVAAVVNVLQYICVGKRQANMSTHQVLEIRKVYADSLDAIFACGWNNADRKAGLIGCLVAFHAANPEKAIEFSRGFIDMTGLPPKSPIAALRRWLLNGHFEQNQNGRLKLVKVTASACIRFADGNTAEKLYENEEALNRIRAAQKAKVRKVQEIVETVTV